MSVPEPARAAAAIAGSDPRIERLDGGSSSISITFVPALRAIGGGRS
jgi:hypothetical protein